MNIALMIYGSLDLLTGGFIYDRFLVDYLGKRGASVRVVSLPWDPYLPALTANCRLGRHILPKGIDLVLQDQLIAPSVFRLNRSIPQPIVAIVHQVHSAQPRPALMNAFFGTVEKSYYRTIQGAVFNSQFTQTTAQKRLGYSGPSIVAYPGSNRLKASASETSIRRRCFEKGPLRLLFLGNITRNKGLLETVRSLQGWNTDYWRLTIVGNETFDPKYAAGVKKYIREKRLDENISFAGVLRGSRLEEALKTSHLLLLPFTVEGFGMAYIEGMGYGLPAVGSTLGAAGEIIDQGKTGFLVPPQNPVILAEFLETVYRDREKLFTMSMAARQRFESHPGWDESMESIYQFLQDFV